MQAKYENLRVKTGLKLHTVMPNTMQLMKLVGKGNCVSTAYKYDILCISWNELYCDNVSLSNFYEYSYNLNTILYYYGYY